MISGSGSKRIRQYLHEPKGRATSIRSISRPGSRRAELESDGPAPAPGIRFLRVDAGQTAPGECLTDQVDWDSALREDNGNVNALGLYDLDRNIRPVGEAYRRLIHQWRETLESESFGLHFLHV